MKSFLLFLFVCFFITEGIMADGVLQPQNKNYPKDLLKTKSTQVTVKINGVVAETIVEQQFQNEWNQSTDAVYSFPLPSDARSIRLLYWKNDTCYKAILKVKQQDTNPGTGSGGFTALLNEYIGKNGIRLTLKNIRPGEIQKVELHYLSLVKSYEGKLFYRYPLNTSAVSQMPVDYFSFRAELNSQRELKNAGITSHADYKVLQDSPNKKVLYLERSKMYLTQDVDLNYSAADTNLAIDFYSAFSDTAKGYFSLFVNTPSVIDTARISKKNIIFYINNTARMNGIKLQQSILAIDNMLQTLTPKDMFNIITENYSVNTWKPQLVQASQDNIAAARAFIKNITGLYNGYLDGLTNALHMFTGGSAGNIILLFTDGYAYFDPAVISSHNESKAGIFCIAMGSDVDRARLEMLSGSNYGFTEYLKDDDVTPENILKIMHRTDKPLLSEVLLSFSKTDAAAVLPQRMPNIFLGNYIFAAGKFNSKGESELNISGLEKNGRVRLPFNVNFTGSDSSECLTEKIWAKEMIDQLEREISVLGETPQRKDSLIQLSLKHEIRCRYTSYIADYETIYTTDVTVEKPAAFIPQSYIAGNYPNPFNPSTKIRIYISNASVSKIKLIRIYNILGQLVAVIDITHYTEGWHDIQFKAEDMKGNMLPSGVYIVSLQVGSDFMNSIKINIVK